MARYILIDSNSGYIFGDSADLNGRIFQTDDALEFAAALDASIGEHGRSYEWGDADDRHRSCYHVYRADIDGSDAVTIVHDGQDQETIDSVMRDCRREGIIVWTRAAD